MPRSHKAFSLGPLGGHKVHKMVKFRPRGMVDKREMEQAQLFETADERGCTPMFGAAHRRASAVPYPRPYDVARYVHLVGTKFTNRSRFLSWPGRPCPGLDPHSAHERDARAPGTLRPPRRSPN